MKIVYQYKYPPTTTTTTSLSYNKYDLQSLLTKPIGKTSSTDSGESISFHTEKSSDSTSGVDVNDDIYQLTDEIVDKHLDDLKRECLSYETRDVAKFMEKLKTQSESIDGESQDEKNITKGEIVVLEKKTQRRESESRKELGMISKQKAEGNKSETVGGGIDKKKDSTLKVEKPHQRKASSSPTAPGRKPKTIDMDSLSPTPQADSQVQIIKIKSPGGSRRASRETSRNNSIERSPSKEKQQTLKKPEGGILKKPSPKFGKASECRLSNSLRPDSFISPFSSFESKSDKLSPSSEALPPMPLPTVSAVKENAQKRASFSDYVERDPNDYHHQAMKTRSLESSLEHLKSAMKHQSSYERVSPIPYINEYIPNKYYGLSAQPSIESNRSPIRYCSPVPGHTYYNEPYYEYPRSGSNNHSKKSRESRSLERPDFSRQSSSEYERYYDEEPRSRRHSVYEHRSIPYHYYSLSPEDYLISSHYEQPSACVDCYYQSYRQQPHNHYPQQPPPLPQRNPSQIQQQQLSLSSSQQQQLQQQQHSKSPSQSRQRQSRSRKKLTRRMSSNYFNKSFDDDDMQNVNAAAAAKKAPLLHETENEEIRV